MPDTTVVVEATGMFLFTVVVVDLALGAKTFASTSGLKLTTPSANATLKNDAVIPTKTVKDRNTLFEFICAFFPAMEMPGQSKERSPKHPSSLFLRIPTWTFWIETFNYFGQFSFHTCN